MVIPVKSTPPRLSVTVTVSGPEQLEQFQTSAPLHPSYASGRAGPLPLAPDSEPPTDPATTPTWQDEVGAVPPTRATTRTKKVVGVPPMVRVT